MSFLNRRTFLHSTAASLAVTPAAALLAAQAARADEPASPKAKSPNANSSDAKGTTDTSKLGHTPHTKFAVNLEMWWRKLPFIERMKMSANYGFPGVEFWPWRGKDLDAIERVSKDTGLVIAQFSAWGFTPGMNDPKNHDAFVREVEESCQIAKRLNVKKMCVVGGDDQPGMTQEEMHKNIITALKRVAPIAEKHEVMLILEPMNIRVDHKGHCLYGSPPALRICREVNSPMVKILWDLYHMHISEGDLCGHLKDGYDQVGYLQLADHPGRHEPGTGEIHYNRVLKQAHDLGYRDYVGLECTPAGAELAAAQGVAAADVW